MLTALPGGSPPWHAPVDDVAALLAIARAELVGDPSDVVRVLHQSDWPALVESVEHHGLTTLLYRLLADGLGDSSQRAALLHLAEARVQANLLRANALAAALHCLREVDIPALALKGPALALLLYDDLGSRCFADLDVLVREHDLDRSITALEALGWRRDETDAGWRGLHHVRLLSDRQTILELHWRPLPLPRTSMLDWNLLWHSHAQVTIGGAPVPTPAGAALLLYLATHGGIHRWLRIGWMVDYGRLRAGLAPETLAEAYHEAHGRGLVRALTAADELLRALVGLETTVQVNARYRTSARVEVSRVALRLCRELPTSVLPDGPILLWEQAQLWDRRSDRLRALASALEPTGIERRWLPKSLAAGPVGWAVRCTRLAYRWGRYLMRLVLGPLRRRPAPVDDGAV